MHNKANHSHSHFQCLVIEPSGSVVLFLPNKNYKARRVIGRIGGGVFHTERTEAGIMRAFGGSVGFCYALMRRGGFERVVVHLPTRTLETTRCTILRRGRFLEFRANGLEKQIFLPLSEFGHHVESKRRQEGQFELFS